MTPLLGTKTPSAPAGDKSGGDGRAARPLLSCALWRGMGRLWRGMGGMGCPEPLSAHRPHQQQGLSGFHETRDPRPGYCQARGKCQHKLRGFHETRNTRHESRLLCFSPITRHETWFLWCLLVLKGFSLFFRPGLLSMRTTSPEIDLTPVVAALAIKADAPKTATRPVRFFTRHETRDTKHGFYAYHETRNTNHGFFSPSVRKGRTTGNPCPDRRARRPVAAFLRVVARHGAAMARHGRPPSPAPAARPVGFSPATNHATCFSPAPGDPRESNPKPAQRVFYETRDANQGFFSVGAQGPHNQNRRPDTVPTGKSLFSSSLLFTIVHHCSLLFTIVRHCSEKN